MKKQQAAEAYPLSWPHGWPRHKGDRSSDSRFSGPTFTWNRVFHGLQEELRRIGATDIIVSTNQPVRQDGLPYAQQRAINDPGVAVYFNRKGKPHTMARDQFCTVIGNMRSLAMAIEGMRQMERHGGAVMLERAFEGFLALPPPSWKKPWRDVFGLRENDKLVPGELKSLYRALAKQRHSDGGGNDVQMAELNVAFAEAKEELGLTEG